MEVRPYNQQSTKKEQVEEMFDNIAPNYDLLNRVLSLGIDTIWRKKAIRTIKKQQPTHLLDIATGTADLAIEANKMLNPDHITGIDISHEMLEYGRKKLEKQGLSDKISLVKDDSENLSFPDASFDVATASFGVRNFGDLDKGLSEINRVLEPGGQLIVLEFTKPVTFPFKQLFNIYFKYFLPVIGKFKSKDSRAYKYLYESVQAFPDYDQFLDRMKKAGFSNCSYTKLSLGICAIYQGFK
jgi:demethylmenaquinone methyltransferase/2-methoxy-6-polyprenyl-1,4-benzoquinol methylase